MEPAGLLSGGLREAGFEVIGAVDLDGLAFAIAHRLNHTHVKLSGEQDIRGLTAKAVIKNSELSQVNLIYWPLARLARAFHATHAQQRHSVNDPRNDLIFDFLRFVRALRPQTVMLENVPGLSYDHRYARLARGWDAFDTSTLSTFSIRSIILYPSAAVASSSWRRGYTSPRLRRRRQSARPSGRR